MKHTKKILITSVFILIVLLLFFPIGAYFFSFVILAIVLNDKNWIVYKPIISIVFIILLLTIIINEVSMQSFLLKEDDFTTYYNNYVHLLNGSYSNLFYFGGGFEIGLPIFNLILSKILNAPYPYIYKSIYIVLFFITGLSLTNKFIAFYKNDINLNKTNKYLFYLFYLLFFKLSMLLTIERQAIASYFVLLAILNSNSNSNSNSKYIFIILGSLFHLSTPVVYFVVNKIFTIKTHKTLILYSVALLLFSLFSFNILNMLYVLLPNSKLGYAISYMSNNEFVTNERIKVFKEVIYIIPLILFGFYCVFKKIKVKFLKSILLLFVFLLALSSIPGVPIRLTMPILYFIIGFYYCIMCSNMKRRTQVFIIIGLAFLSSYRIFNAVGYYSRYPMISDVPAYYLPYFFVSKEYVERDDLPLFNDIIRINNNKL